MKYFNILFRKSWAFLIESLFFKIWWKELTILIDKIELINKIKLILNWIIEIFVMNMNNDKEIWVNYLLKMKSEIFLLIIYYILKKYYHLIINSFLINSFLYFQILIIIILNSLILIILTTLIISATSIISVIDDKCLLSFLFFLWSWFNIKICL